jgi:hypothetical protein
VIRTALSAVAAQQNPVSLASFQAIVMMDGSPTHEWSAVVQHFDSLADVSERWVPMRDCVRRIAAGPLASGMYPVASLHTLRLYQHQVARHDDDELRLDWESSEFVLRYLPGSGVKRDPRFALAEPPGIWKKSGDDGLALLERALHHLRWFVQYSGTLGGLT